MRDVTRTLTDHYERCLEQHGPTPQGMDWGDDEQRLALRFDAICRAAGLDRHTAHTALLDVGCGCGLLLDHLRRAGLDHVAYAGLDASASMIEAARRRHPEIAWTVGDITEVEGIEPADWVVANGVLTERREVPHDRMVRFAERVVSRMFARCRVGIVFNALSTHVNFEDPALFYWDPAEVLAMAVGALSRHVTIHHDLTLYEYFCVVRRVPWTGGRDG